MEYTAEEIKSNYESLRKQYPWIKEDIIISNNIVTGMQLVRHVNVHNINRALLIDEYFDIKEGDNVIDGGAYQGEFLTYFSNKVGTTGHVFAFEPHPRCVFAANVNVNRMDNVIILPIALSSVIGLNQLYIDTDKDDGATIMSNRTRNRDGKIETIYKGMSYIWTFAIPLDYLPSLVELDNLNFIKLNVEGAEVEVLNGGKHLIEKYKPQLMIHHHDLDGKPQDVQVKKILKELNYNVKDITEHIIGGWPND